MTAGDLIHGEVVTVSIAPASGEVSDEARTAEPVTHGSVDPHAPEPVRPTTWNPEVLHGPLSTRALLRLDEALRLADAATGLTFSVYIGDLAEPTRDTAQALLYRLRDPHSCVLLAVSPNQRLLEIVTGSVARKRVLDRDCKLAALSMAAAFTGGDLGGGLIAGLAQLAEHAGRS